MFIFFLIFLIVFIVALVTFIRLHKDKSKDNQDERDEWIALGATIVSFIAMLICIGNLGNNGSTENSSSHHSHRHVEPKTYLAVDGQQVKGGTAESDKTFNAQGMAQYDVHVRKGTQVYLWGDDAHNNKNVQSQDGTAIHKLSPTHYTVQMKYSPKYDSYNMYDEQVAVKAPRHRENSDDLNVSDNHAEKVNKKRAKAELRQRQSQKRNAKALAQTGTTLDKLDHKYHRMNVTEELVDGTIMSVTYGPVQYINGTVKGIAHPSDNRTKILMSVPHLDHMLMVTVVDQDNIGQGVTDISTDTHWNHEVRVGDHLRVYGKDFGKDDNITKSMVKHGIGSQYDGKTIYTMDTPRYIINNGQ